jgi:hypothetical protein
MLTSGLLGGVAGATGTVALNITTYGDMLLRGRAASDVPAQVAGVIADTFGIEPLSTRDAGGPGQHRRSAAGALLGYATGLGLGAVYGVCRARGVPVSGPCAGVALGLLAMMASDVPIALTGVSNPRSWTPADWAADLIPHLIYGLVTAQTYEAIAPRRDG